eukprot:767064-Amphidinium_carterae.1
MDLKTTALQEAISYRESLKDEFIDSNLCSIGSLADRGAAFAQRSPIGTGSFPANSGRVPCICKRSGG